MSYPKLTSTVTVTIAAAGNLSAAVDLSAVAVVGIVMPAAWDAANLTFAGSETQAGTYTNVYDDAGTEYPVTAAASRRILVPPADLLGGCWLKVRSGTAAVPVNQAAERVLTLLVRPV